MLGTLAPNGVPNAPRYFVQPTIDACLGAQQRAMNEAPLAGLGQVYSACIISQSTTVAPVPAPEDFLQERKK
jgi:hypothetical protein